MTARRRPLSPPSLSLLQWLPLLLVAVHQAAAATSPMLLYSTSTDIRVANTSTPGRNVPIITDLEQGSAVDFYYKGNLVCWSDQGHELIQCIKYNGTVIGEKMRVVSERVIGLFSPSGIAIDWFTEKIYWTDGETNRIEVTSIDGRYRKVLFWSDIDLARAIAVVPMKGLMFWTDWGEVPKIERAGMNGEASTRKVVVKDDIYWPNGLTIDYTKEMVYWLDAKLKFIDVMDYDGNNRKRIVKGGLVYAIALTLFSEKLYWTDWKSWSIHSWDITTEGPIKNLIKSDPVPMDIRVYDPSRQPPPPPGYPCSRNNGNCSHLCLLSPSSPGYTCACQTGIKLIDNSTTQCADRPQALLLVAQRSVISKISLDSPDFTPYQIPLHGVKRAITVDYDQRTDYMYWADTIAKSISRARLDGSEQVTILQSGLGVPDSIAIDSPAGNIYWTDPAYDTISVARLDGSIRKVLIYSELYEPRAIALHLAAGWMFWSDWNERKPKIERASLDGSERTLLVSDRLAWPNGIALDTAAGRLYWGDARTHKIEACNMDGTDRREIHDTEILHIFGLTLLGNYLYWTDMQRRTLDRINKDTGMEREPIVEQLANMMGVKAVGMAAGAAAEGEAASSVSHCASNNGNCSHFCFNRPEGVTCSCPLGLELGKDRRKCVQPEAYLLYGRKNIIGRIGIENKNSEDLLPLKELKEVSAIAIHVSESKVYWSDSKSKSISRCSENGSGVERILEWAGLVEGLAVDWAGQNMYWTDSAAQRIEVARLDGSSRRALLWQGLKKPKSIALDPRKGNMYWSELGSKTIKRAGMDGSSPTVLLEQVGRANSLAIDYEKRTLYWATLEPPAIEVADLDGANRRQLIADNAPMPYALTLFQDWIYWGDWTTGEVEMARKWDGSGREQIHAKVDYIAELSVFHKSRQPGGNQCSVDNGGCAHLCLAHPAHPARAPRETDYSCICPAHYRLNGDNVTCSEPEEFLLFAQRNSVSRIMTSSGDCADAALPVTGLKNIRAFDYDPVNKHLYWMDEESHSIKRTPVSSTVTSAASDSSVVAGELGRPFHLVLDVLGRALYWTCSDADSINVTGIDNNSSAGVIVRGEGMMPRHLALHQIKRLLVWTDVGLGGIMRANVDGSSRRELARAANATALAIDQAAGVIYWALSRQIHAVHLDGTNKRVVWQGGWAMSLAVYGGALYWAGGGGGGGGGAGGERPLMRVSLARRDAPAAPVPHASRVTALVAVDKVARSHPCYGGAACGGAAGACLAEGTCGCGAGCARAPAPCPPAHFACALARSGPAAECVPAAWKCDGQTDCPDGSDEWDCGECGRGVRCVDGGCGESLGGCETGVACEPGEFPDAFRCPGGRTCLAARLLCDGRRHCEDGADEAAAACGAGGGGGEPGPGAPPHAAAPARESSLPVAAGVVAGAVVAALLAWTALRRWRAAGAGRGGGGLARAQEPAPSAAAQYRLYPRKPANGSYASQQRMRPLGASGSDSGGGERYPRETLNPPPSPATEAGAGAGAGSGAGGGGRRRAYRHYRAINRPPPPTPCSTDACESDYAGATGAAPPPTPCATSPPSPSAPSSRSSTYFSPFPPPPSPVPHLSDS